MQVSLQTARRVAVHTQLLDGRARLPKGKEGVARTIETLGYTQVDTISVIERAHHHTLWTRRPDYDAGSLQELQASDRRVFEYWGHALSLLPMSDFRFYQHKMRSFLDPYGKWEKERIAKYGHLMPPALKRLAKDGPLSARELAALLGTKRQEAHRREPTKSALELLFLQGKVMVSERRGFERVYDIPERVLPAGTNVDMPTEAEVGRFLVRRALSAHGLATLPEIVDHIHAAGREIIASALRQLLADTEVTSLTIKDNGSEYYALTEDLDRLLKLRKVKSQVHLLSPFDNLVIQRDRIKRLFDFDYALECYVTPGKRKFGYFALPILWGEQLVGRLDPKAYRPERMLAIQNLAFESHLDAYSDFLPSFAVKLWELARFNRCEKVTVKRVSPARVKRELERELRRQRPADLS